MTRNITQVCNSNITERMAPRSGGERCQSSFEKSKCTGALGSDTGRDQATRLSNSLRRKAIKSLTNLCLGPCSTSSSWSQSYIWESSFDSDFKMLRALQDRSLDPSTETSLSIEILSILTDRDISISRNSTVANIIVIVVILIMPLLAPIKTLNFMRKCFGSCQPRPAFRKKESLQLIKFTPRSSGFTAVVTESYKLGDNVSVRVMGRIGT